MRPIERISASVIAVLIIGGIIWGSQTIPIQAVFSLGLASVLGFLAWLVTTYRYPVQSRRVELVKSLHQIGANHFGELSEG